MFYQKPDMSLFNIIYSIILMVKKITPDAVLIPPLKQSGKLFLHYINLTGHYMLFATGVFTYC